MSERELRGLAAGGGVAVGTAFVVRDPDTESAERGRAALERALRALASVAHELRRRSEELRAAGHAEEADILAANVLMAEDPLLEQDLADLVDEQPAAAALQTACERRAALLEALPDPLLAARAADVREIGRRAARLAAGIPAYVAPTEPSILVARELGPADVADVRLGNGRVLGLALAAGAVTSHAAIMARSLGVPMVVALGDELLDVGDGETMVLDGERGRALIRPDQETLEWAAATTARAAARRELLAADRGVACTRDGREIALLCNAAGAPDVAAGLAAGAEGVGLLRTELEFLDARAWPLEEQHYRALAPSLRQLAGRIATVRTLDFGEDKTPPFLAGISTRGIALMLEHPDALAAQLRAILRAGVGTRLRVLLPMVESPAEVRAVRALILEAARAVGWEGSLPELGAMVETPSAAQRASEITLEADFLSIGTNDLVQYTLDLDRERPLASALAAADPAVLALVARTAAAAGEAGIPVEVCGEAACEPQLAALFVGLGVTELSVAPARLDEIRATVRKLAFAVAAKTARRALRVATAGAALELAAQLVSAKAGDERGEALDSFGSIRA